MYAKMLAIGALLMMVLGCTQQPLVVDEGRPIEADFQLGNVFTVKEGNYPGYQYNNNFSSPIRLKVLSFTDSRCPNGVQCVWAGEVGLNLQVIVFEKTSDPKTFNGPKIKEMYLGETTKRKDTAFGYEIELVSIDFEKKEAQIRVSVAAQPPTGEKQWFSYDPKQCGTNPWETWDLAKIQDYRNEEYLVEAWFKVANDIEVSGYASKKVSDIVCLSCSCPRGDEIAVLVNSKDSAKMKSLGWKIIGNKNVIACPMDAKICPDGSAVGREGPFCEFAACPETNEKQPQWFSIEPIQCGGNEWQQWQGENLAVDGEPLTEKEIIGIWLKQKYGITAIDYASKQVSEIVCMACSCPRGDQVAVLVDSKDAAKMKAIGWAAMGNIACTEEARLCPDGSGVGRQAPFCEFTACPAPDFIIRKVDVPGFVMNPVEKTTTIYAGGKVTITTTALRDGNSTSQTLQISNAKLTALKNFILASNVFGITEEDARTCIADLPTKSLAISIDNKEASIYQIGAECDKEKLAAAYTVLNKIDSTIEASS